MSSVNEKMTAIANAIRSKTGKTDSLTLDQMATEIDSIASGGIQSASGEHKLESNSAYTIEIDVSNVGFVPDLAIVRLDDTELEYTTQPTKMWIVEYQPDLLNYVPLAEPANKVFTTTNMALVFRGAKGTYTQAIAATNANFIGKLTTSDNVIIKVGRISSSNPLIAGSYKWFAYKIWE